MRTGLSAGLITAQSAVSRTPYKKLLFTSYDTLTTVDLSSDSAVYGNRQLMIQHVEGSYNDYAAIALKNATRDIPNLKGYWVEIGYGDYVSGLPEYASTARLWVKHQQTVSIAGNLTTILECEGMWAKLKETLLRMGNPPYYIVKNTALIGEEGYLATLNQMTPYAIISYILSLTDPAMTLDALAEEDSIIDTLIPNFTINEFSQFETAASVIYRLLTMTGSYLKPKAGLAWEIKYPQDSDVADITVYNDTAPKFYSYVNRENVNLPNRIYLFANAGSDGLWTDIIAAQADDATSQAEYGIVPDVVLAPELTTLTDAAARAGAILNRQAIESSNMMDSVLAGKLVIQHNCQIELMDKIAISDTRGS